MPTEKSDLERAFIARVFYRRGSKSLSQSFVDAKKEGVNRDWFADPKCRIVWMAAEELFGEAGFSSISVYKILKRANAIARESKERDLKGVSVDTEFMDKAEKLVTGSEGFGDFARMLRNAVVARKCAEVFANAAESFKNEDDAMATAAKIITQVQGVMNGEAPSRSVSVASLVDDVVRQYDEAYHNVQELGNADYTPGLPLPWRKLSFTLNGFPSVLTVLAARPGVGKTSLAVEMMRFWMDRGIKVVFNSLDMAGVEFMKRQLSEISQVSSRKLQFGKSSPDDWQKYDRPAILEAGEKMKQWERDGIFTLYTEPDIDVLKANVKILKDQNKIDVLVVDYIQLMNYRGAERLSKQQVVTRISNILHAITTELGIPVLALSQINRDSSKEGNAPQLHDIKDSGAIEQDATNVLILHPNWPLRNKWTTNEPPSQFTRQETPNSASLKSLMPMWLIVAKARDGDAGTELPFLVVQNKYSWYLGDYEANKEEMWNRVYDNWKHDKIEKVWDANGALIHTEQIKQIEAFNEKLPSRRSVSTPVPTSTATPTTPAPTLTQTTASTPTTTPQPPAPPAPAPSSTDDDEDYDVETELAMDGLSF